MLIFIELTNCLRLLLLRTNPAKVVTRRDKSLYLDFPHFTTFSNQKVSIHSRVMYFENESARYSLVMEEKDIEVHLHMCSPKQSKFMFLSKKRTIDPFNMESTNDKQSSNLTKKNIHNEASKNNPDTKFFRHTKPNSTKTKPTGIDNSNLHKEKLERNDDYKAFKESGFGHPDDRNQVLYNQEATNIKCKEKGIDYKIDPYGRDYGTKDYIGDEDKMIPNRYKDDKRKVDHWNNPNGGEDEYGRKGDVNTREQNYNEMMNKPERNIERDQTSGINNRKNLYNNNPNGYMQSDPNKQPYMNSKSEQGYGENEPGEQEQKPFEKEQQEENYLKKLFSGLFPGSMEKGIVPKEKDLRKKLESIANKSNKHGSIESDSSIDDETIKIKNVKVVEVDDTYFMLSSSDSICVTYFNEQFIFAPCNKSDAQLFRVIKEEQAESIFNVKKIINDKREEDSKMINQIPLKKEENKKKNLEKQEIKDEILKKIKEEAISGPDKKGSLRENERKELEKKLPNDIIKELDSIINLYKQRKIGTPKKEEDESMVETKIGEKVDKIADVIAEKTKENVPEKISKPFTNKPQDISSLKKPEENYNKKNEGIKLTPVTEKIQKTNGNSSDKIELTPITSYTKHKKNKDIHPNTIYNDDNDSLDYDLNLKNTSVFNRLKRTIENTDINDF